MKILNIYGQEDCHQDARIIGNREGLIELRTAINKVLMEMVYGNTSIAGLTNDGKQPLFASDGEGYEVRITRNDDVWGTEGGPDSFWHKPESDPQYTFMECAKRRMNDSSTTN